MAGREVTGRCEPLVMASESKEQKERIKLQANDISSSPVGKKHRESPMLPDTMASLPAKYRLANSARQISSTTKNCKGRKR